MTEVAFAGGAVSGSSQQPLLLGRWFQYLRKTHPEFEDVRSKIFNFFAEKCCE
ncbi:unnamed protein product [Amoebophrya sp. A25]|nr:unnamed protein product [Amoebophrya sp. A25]|eukprot:GSA25T00016826001.1